MAFAASTVDEVLQLTPNLAHGKRIYQLCAACHGATGVGEQHGEFPSIAGQHRSVLVKQLLDIQSKKRLNPTMYPFSDAKTLGGDQGLADVTAYIASLPLNTEPVQGPGLALDKGQKLFTDNCIGCHGIDGDGQAAARYPRLRGQHQPYLQREITWIRDGVRKNGDPAMMAILQTFSDEDIAAVADYISTIRGQYTK